MRITICGTGAMACLFGARLAAVAEVTLLGTWTEGIETIRRRGIRTEEGSSAKVARVNADYLDSPAGVADLVLVLAKSWQSARIGARIGSLLDGAGVVLTLQNGLGNLELLGPRAYLGVTTRGATLLAPGHVRPAGNGPTHIAGPKWVAEILEQAGIEARCCGVGETESLLWGKLAVNCAINPLAAILRVTNGELLERPEALMVLKQSAEECAAVARAGGIALPFANAADWACEVARLTATNRSSMLQDIQRGAPTEIDAINGALVRTGERLGVAVPVNATLWRLIRAISQPVRASSQDRPGPGERLGA